ncbi:MAG: hypothetical protein U5N85_09560 [Arcicella sp.]|nr:hypothetical protein [Arcicella sp.]
MTTLALEIDSRQHLDMLISLARKLKVKSKIFEDDILTPYEKSINGEAMTMKELSSHLDSIVDSNKNMSYETFKQKLSEWK